MSPVPDGTQEESIFSSASTTSGPHGISSSDELDQIMFNEQVMDLGSLAVDSMDSITLSEDDEPPTLTEDPIPQITTCSAPSTPTGERDPPVIFRKTSSLSIPPTNISTLPQVEVRYENIRNNDDGNSFFDTFFGCFKPCFSAMNKFSGIIKYRKDSTSTLTKSTDDWEIEIDKIINNLELIGTGIEGSVYRGKLNDQDVACKRVKTKEETNIKHLKKLNHLNVIKFRGISIAPPLFYIVMEYCAYGSLYHVLKRRREIDSCTKPTQVLDWSKQISNGVDYLHLNKIVHRDLKSPNILFFDKHILKISDFGTSQKLINRQSQSMSFNGTSAWMAPEVIRQELSSEKIDVWSFGIVLWEILTCTVPYNNIDPTAVMWGVGKGSLTLPIPSSAPEGFKSLMTKCWNQQPSNRPSFQEIIKHLDISKHEIILFEQEQEYAELTRIWSIEINEHLSKFPTIDILLTLQMTNDELMKKRQEELQHITDIRAHYEKRVQQVSTLYIELKSLTMQLGQREHVIKEKERSLYIKGKKRIINPITEARKKSLQIIKAATYNLNDPIHLLSHKKRHSNKPNNGSSNSHLSTGKQSANHTTLVSSPIVTDNQDLSNTKNIQRRKKSLGHRRNNSKGSVTSWTPPSIIAIEDQEKKRASINRTPNIIGEAITIDQRSDTSSEINPVKTIKSPLPSISADIHSKSNINNRELNPKNLKLDLQNPMNLPVSPSNHQRSSTNFPVSPRKSSSGGPEDYDETQYHTFSRQRRRRNINLNNNKINSPSSIASRSIKSNNQYTSQIDHHSQTDDLNKHSRYVTFQLSPSIINDRNSQRKTFKYVTYTSSEEGEVEESHSDTYIFDDEKHRAKHGKSHGNFSSESEIYAEKNPHLSSKNDGLFSDEDGHVSDDRPGSCESILNSEPEHQ